MIKIVGEKVVLRGDKYIRIKEVDALEMCVLPREYTDSEPAVWLSDGRLYDKGCGWLVSPGNIIREERFYEDIEFIKKCGDRLNAINARQKVENDGWGGAIEVRI